MLTQITVCCNGIVLEELRVEDTGAVLHELQIRKTTFERGRGSVEYNHARSFTHVHRFRSYKVVTNSESNSINICTYAPPIEARAR
jgi:hypothetical protein